MKYTTENDGTKRYNKEGSNNIIIEEEFFFGCEFEFYTKENFNIEIFIKELLDISDVDLLVNELTVPKCEGSEYCMHLKKDMTLKDNGFEVSTIVASDLAISTIIGGKVATVLGPKVLGVVSAKAATIIAGKVASAFGIIFAPIIDYTLNEAAKALQYDSTKKQFEDSIDDITSTLKEETKKEEAKDLFKYL